MRDQLTRRKNGGRRTIHAKNGGRRTIHESTAELLAAVDPAKAVRPAQSDFLLCRRGGSGCIDEVTGEAHGWDSMGQRSWIACWPRRRWTNGSRMPAAL
jgi:hypothetical protein